MFSSDSSDSSDSRDSSDSGDVSDSSNPKKLISQKNKFLPKHIQ